MGGGISTMHYTGMAAMRLPAMCSYDPTLLALSVILAILISLVAVWLTFQFRGEVRRSPWLKTGSAIVMGSAIPIMHYTGMAAAHFMPSATVPDMSQAVSTSTLGFAGVSVVTVLISGVAVLTSAVDRRLSAQKVQLAASERRYHLLVEGIRDYAIFMLSPNGEVTSWNHGAERIEGYRTEEIIGRHFSCFYTEEDLQGNKPAEHLTRAAEAGKVEVQGWRVRKDGSRFWADVVITTVWDSGHLQGFSKVVRDITERKRYEDSLRELSARLLQLRDEERRHIARELHDSAGQIIAAINMNLTQLSESGSRYLPEDGKVIKESLDFLGQLSSEVRTISYLLHPPLLDEVGLSSALRLYVEGFSERSKIRVELDIPSDLGRLSQELETSIFRIIQECLTNLHRHSGSQIARIRIWHRANEICVEVTDEGRGVPPEKHLEMETCATTGVGLLGMRERIRQLSGTLEICPGPNGKGTTVSVCVPLRGPSEEPPHQAPANAKEIS